LQLKSLLTGRQQLAPGHNPAGAWAIISLMLPILFIGLTGYWSVKDILGNFMGEAHETVANLTLGIVIIHVIAEIVMSFMQKESLIRSMVTGKKHCPAEQAIRYPMYVVGVALTLV
jgi:cytochrome b